VLDRREASALALKEVYTVPNIDRVIALSKLEGVTSILIDFKLNVDVIVSKSSGLDKKEYIEEVEFIPKLSSIQNVLKEYDLSFVVFKDGEITFKRSRYYRPLVESDLH
jgi:hypothetical protein